MRNPWLDDLAAHNLITFKSHHEALDAWALKELSGFDVAYRMLMSGQIPWQQRQAGVYDCRWGTDTIRNPDHRRGRTAARAAQCAAPPVQRIA